MLDTACEGLHTSSFTLSASMVALRLHQWGRLIVGTGGEGDGLGTGLLTERSRGKSGSQWQAQARRKVLVREREMFAKNDNCATQSSSMHKSRAHHHARAVVRRTMYASSATGGIVELEPRRCVSGILTQPCCLQGNHGAKDTNSDRRKHADATAGRQLDGDRASTRAGFNSLDAEGGASQDLGRTVGVGHSGGDGSSDGAVGGGRATRPGAGPRRV